MNTRKEYRYFFTEKGNTTFIAYLKSIQEALNETQNAILSKSKTKKTENNQKTPLEEFVNNLNDVESEPDKYLEKRHVDKLIDFEVENYLTDAKRTSELMRFFDKFVDDSGISNFKSLWKSAIKIDFLDDETISNLGKAYNKIKGLDLSSLTSDQEESLQGFVVSKSVVRKLLKIFGANEKEGLTTYFHEIEYEPRVANKIIDPEEKVRKTIKEVCGKHRHFQKNLNDIYVDFQDGIAIPDKIKAKIANHSLRLIITGSLGIGKTAYLQKLALNILDEKTDDKNVAPNQVPLFINLREYIDQTQEDKADLLSYIADYYQMTSSELEKLLKGKKDQCVLLLDSLDQVSDLKSNQLIDEISEFVRKYPKNDYILTSRDIVEIRKLENFEVIQLNEIKIEIEFLKSEEAKNDPKIDEHSAIEKSSQKGKNIKTKDKNVETFIENWLKAITNNENVDQKISGILTSLTESEELRSLASKPLILSLICMEYANHKQSNCSEKNEKLSELSEWHIVHRSVKTWLEESNKHYWNKQQQVNGNDISISVNFVYELLEFIAYQTIVIGILNISKAKLSKLISSFVEAYYGWNDRYKTNSFTDQILRFLENTYGFTLLKSDNIYSFPHIIFRSYFAIRYIYNKHEKISKFKEKLLEEKVEISDELKEIIRVAEQFPKKLILGESVKKESDD